HLLCRDPARGQVGDEAGGEPEADVRDVDARGEDGYSDRIHLHGLGPVQGQDDVEVVDHQVQDDVDVEAARGERAQPVNLDEARGRDGRLQDVHRRVEALDVADLEDGLAVRGHADQVLRLGGRRGHGLLDQDVLAGIQE